MKCKLFILVLVSFVTYSCSNEENEILLKKETFEKNNTKSEVLNLTPKIVIDSIKLNNLNSDINYGEPSNPLPPRKN
ncbi:MULTISPECIES: hypothetical protein [unclassified Flavobacterium]|uniref:hypothetical protein n=1 Tax=unclassified Flavobacterium TaxID=196869 RepID=UPI00131B0755|nr:MULTISPECIES: hypothetical protein [unclassified Flavobacterium]